MFPKSSLILVVDDMTAMRHMLKGMLKGLGYSNIVEAKDGAEAWEVLEDKSRLGTPIDVVLSDWNMPIMQGIDLLRKIRSDDKFSKLPFMMITAEGQESQVIEAIKAKVTDYVCKPLAPAVFKDKLENVWKKSQ